MKNSKKCNACEMYQDEGISRYCPAHEPDNYDEDYVVEKEQVEAEERRVLHEETRLKRIAEQ